MNFIDVLILAVGVSMDAFAVAICKGLSVNRLRASHVVKTGLWFGFFQALMPLAGYYAGSGFSDAVSAVDHWIAFILLGIIAFNMIREALSSEVEETDADFSFRTMLVLAVATSIDALAVGISMAFLKVNIWTSVLLIGIVTCAFSMAGVKIGNTFGARYKKPAELTGGVILAAMGIRILIEHTLLQ